MVQYIINCKAMEDVEPAKKLAEEQGGKIIMTFTIIPGFVIDMPEDSVTTFESSKHVASVEPNGEVKTQA